MGEAVNVALGSMVSVIVGTAVFVGEGDGVWLGVGVKVGGIAYVMVAVKVGVTVGVLVGVGEAAGMVKVAVTPASSVPDWVSVGVAVARPSMAEDRQRSTIPRQ